MWRATVSLSVVAAVVAAAAAHAGGGATSDVTIDNYYGNDDKVFVVGSVSSAKSLCTVKREVEVIGRDESTGETRSFGTDLTSKSGKFKVGEPIPFPEDYVYAKVRQLNKGGEAKCGRDRSAEISTSG